MGDWTRRLRIVTGLLTLLLAAAGCSSPATTDDEPAGDVGAARETEPATETEPAGEPVTISVATNATRGGQGDALATWMAEDVVPAFEQRMADDGRDVTVEIIEGGVPGDEFKQQVALDLSVGQGADVIAFDQFWVSEFATAGYLRPLVEVVGPEVADWEGWEQIPEAVQGSFEFEGDRYGIPFGTDGRVLFYRRDLLTQAGLGEDWQPESWQDLLGTARTIAEELPDVTPLQLNAGVSMGEATTLQGFIPVLLGTGADLYDGGWLGDSPQLREALELYDTIYAEGLADAELQLRADGRDRSFQEFAEGSIAILLEGDFFWRAVVVPETGTFPMENRDEVVGWALIPAREPRAGIRGQDVVSASGGTGWALNPNTAHPREAWEFLSYLGSREAVAAFAEREPRITAREDVNAEAIASDPLLSFIAEEVLPVTWYRPGLEEYPQVSELITRTVENVVADRAEVAEAAEQYQAELEGIVGADNVRGQ